MPALVNSSVGSFAGTSDELGTMRCPRAEKKSRNRCRISWPVTGVLLEIRGGNSHSCTPGPLPHWEHGQVDVSPLVSSLLNHDPAQYTRGQDASFEVSGQAGEGRNDPALPAQPADRRDPAHRAEAEETAAHGTRSGEDQDWS